jgi:hypothetical protein
VEGKDLYYLFGAISIVVGGIISTVSSHFSLKNQIDLEKQRTDQLEERLKDHENEFKQHSEKVEKKLDNLVSAIHEVKIIIERNNKRG